MKKYFLLFSLFTFLFSCSNESVNFNEAELIPKKLTHDIFGSIGHHHYNNLGHPTAFTNEDSTLVISNNTYNTLQQLIHIGIYYVIESSGVSFDYNSGAVNKMILGSSNGTNSSTTTTFTRSGNQIIAAFESSLGWSGTGEFTFQTENHKLLEKYISDITVPNPLLKYYFYYDPENRPILIERHKYNDETSNYELDYKVNQTFDDKNNFFKNASAQDILANIYHHLYTRNVIDRDSDLTFVMNQFSPNNLLTQTITSASGFSFTYTFDYEYNEHNYPISGTRTDNDVVRTYTFEYH